MSAQQVDKTMQMMGANFNYAGGIFGASADKGVDTG